MKRTRRWAVVIAAMTTLTALPSALLAHGNDGHAKAPKAPISTNAHAFGMEGDPKKANRMITIAMDDSMHYSQSELGVAQGETITLVVSNNGKLMHELVIGTEEELQKHSELMRKYPGMEHDEPYMAHVKPGATESITWQFTNAGAFKFGCLVAGHYEAGMSGTIAVVAND